MCFVMFFFVKQKTAYEMRISDWSSDVCSSDLTAIRVKLLDKDGAPLRHLRRVLKMSELVKRQPPGHWVQTERAAHEAWASLIEKAPKAAQLMHILTARVGEHNAVVVSQKRSEEHTSELQSLMRLSYAVFCLKKKKKR